MEIEAEVAQATAIPEPIAETHVSPPDERAEDGNWEDKADADLKSIFAKHNPARDDAGRFQGKAAPEAEVLPDQPPAAIKETVAPSIPVPQSWSADVKDKWSTLPPDVQTYIAKRESEAHEAITRQGSELKAYEPVKQVIERNKDVFERAGVTADDGINRLLAAERLLEQNPVAAITQLAKAYGVDLAAQFGGQANTDSAQTALHQRIAFLENQLNDTSNRISERERMEAQTQQQSVQSLIETFAKDKSDWADLENDILAEITGIRAAINEGLFPNLTPDQMLAKAYERAQRNNPVAFAKRQEAERKAEEEKRLAEAKKRAEDASRVNRTNVRSTPANGRTISTIDDDLKATYRKLNSA